MELGKINECPLKLTCDYVIGVSSDGPCGITVITVIKKTTNEVVGSVVRDENENILTMKGKFGTLYCTGGDEHYELINGIVTI
jgi:hypothetical protein